MTTKTTDEIQIPFNLDLTLERHSSVVVSRLHLDCQRWNLALPLISDAPDSTHRALYIVHLTTITDMSPKQNYFKIQKLRKFNLSKSRH